VAKASQYLKLVDKNGNLVKGECYDAQHMNEISLTAWNWAVNDPAVVPKDSEQGASKPAKGGKGKGEGETGDAIMPGRLGISKQTDRSTVRMLSALDNGEIFPTATLVIQEEYEESPQPFMMEVVLSDVFLVDFKWNANAGDAGMEFDESWELNYRNIKFSYLWRGKPAAWLDVEFDRPPDDSEGASKKSPLSAAEKKSQEDKRIEDIVNARLKKSGK
jgi:type VI protein secretion system component Hcp